MKNLSFPNLFHRKRICHPALPPPSEWRRPKEIKEPVFGTQIVAIAFPFYKNSRLWITQSEPGVGTVIAINETQIVRMNWDKVHSIEGAPAWIRKQLTDVIGDKPACFQKGTSVSVDTGNFSPTRTHVAYHLLVFTEEENKPKIWVNTVLLERYNLRTGPSQQIIACAPYKQIFVTPGTVHSRDTLTISPTRSIATHLWTTGLLVEKPSIAAYVSTTKNQIRESWEMVRQALNPGTSDNQPSSIASRLSRQSAELFGILLSNNCGWFDRIVKDIYRKAADRLRAPIRSSGALLWGFLRGRAKRFSKFSCLNPHSGRNYIPKDNVIQMNYSCCFFAELAIACYNHPNLTEGHSMQESFLFIKKRGEVHRPAPPKETTSLSTLIETLIEARTNHRVDLTPKTVRNITMQGFATLIESKGDPNTDALIFVGSFAQDVVCAVDGIFFMKGFIRLHETYLISPRGIYYSKDDTAQESARWLSNDKKDQPDIKHLQNLLRDVQNNS